LACQVAIKRFWPSMKRKVALRLNSNTTCNHGLTSGKTLSYCIQNLDCLIILAHVGMMVEKMICCNSRVYLWTQWEFRWELVPHYFSLVGLHTKSVNLPLVVELYIHILLSTSTPTSSAKGNNAIRVRGTGVVTHFSRTALYSVGSNMFQN
jgi:hypothetical protein